MDYKISKKIPLLLIAGTLFFLMGCSKRQDGTDHEKANSSVKILQGEIIEEKEEVVPSDISEEFLREKTNKETARMKKKVARIKQKNTVKESKMETKQLQRKVEGIKVTFIELGSVKCIPCKMMEPIIEEIKEEYAGQVKVIFYDVWTAEGRPYARKYNIRTIPTQIFLDKEGNEYFRHQGFFAKDELIDVLKKQGVK